MFNMIFYDQKTSQLLIPTFTFMTSLHNDNTVTFGICFEQHFDIRYLMFYNPSPPRMFLSLDLLSEYRIQYGAIGPRYVTSSFSTWIFCRGVSGFATDCPCGIWCRGLTTCLLHVGPPFGNQFLNNSWAVGLAKWIVYLHFFCILKYAIIYVLIHHIIFWLYLYFVNILYFFKYSCTNIVIDVFFILSKEPKFLPNPDRPNPPPTSPQPLMQNDRVY